MAQIKLDKQDVEQIRLLFEQTPLKDSDIAKIFNVSRKHINQIRNKKRWNYELNTKPDTSGIFIDRVGLYN